jgi:hypothetical protein
MLSHSILPTFFVPQLRQKPQDGIEVGNFVQRSGQWRDERLRTAMPLQPLESFDKRHLPLVLLWFLYVEYRKKKRGFEQSKTSLGLPKT